MKYVDLCKAFIKKQEGGYSYFYDKYVERYGEANSAGEVRFMCLFHADHKPGAASYNVDTGLWKCFSSCDVGGDVFGFWARITEQWSDHLEVETMARQVCIELGIVDNITDEMVETYHQALLCSPTSLSFFQGQTHLSLDTIKNFKLGFVKNRLAIPIVGEHGDWEDVRLYDRTNPVKMLSWKAGHGASRVFPLAALRSNSTLVLFEGEKDCMRAHQCGIPGAITFTSGSGALPDDHEKLFKNKTVYVCYDCDAAGKKGAMKVAKVLAVSAREVKLVALPPEGLPDKGDFTDWADLVGDENVPALFDRLVAAATIVEARRPGSSDAGADPEDNHVDQISYGQISAHGTYGRKLRMLAHVIGASAGLKHYQLPLVVDVYCGRDQGRTCEHCPVNAIPVDEMPMRHRVDPTSEDALQLIRFSKMSQLRTMRRLIGIPDRCGSCRLQEEERSSVQVLLLSEPVELGTMREGASGYKTAFYHGDPITDNRDYYMTGYVHADPKTQESIINCGSAEHARSALEDFTCDEETQAAISYFQPATGVSIAEHFETLLSRIESITGIYGRKDVSTCVLNTIYSALEFTVGNKKVDNGWVDSLIIGDTRTGKSEMAKRIMKFIDIGEFISCENVSLAGLLGGIQIVDGTMIPVWGKWPQNDRGMILLDEITELDGGSKDILGKLSTMRSSGVAEINKIQQARTNARVRSCHVANPGNRSMISSFDCGVRAINTVIRNPEDVARFTCATIVSKDTVDIETILRDDVAVDDSGLGRKMNLLAMLTWSLLDHQIVFSKEANAYVRAAVSRLSRKYHASLPLWENGSGMVKLARLCVPAAVLCGSFIVDELSGQASLVINEAHARHAVFSLEKLYDAPSMAYDRLSRQEFEREDIVDPLAVAAAIMGSFASATPRAIAQYFMMNDEMNRNSFAELTGFRQHAETVWSVLLVNHALVSARNRRDHSVKTPSFVRLLEDISRNTEAWQERVDQYNSMRIAPDLLPNSEEIIRIG